MAMQTVGGTTATGSTAEAAGASRAARFTHASARTHPMPARRVPTRGGLPLPGPRGYPLIGMLPDLFHHVSALPLLRDAWWRYGDAVQLPLGPYTGGFFAHPEAARQILERNRANYRRAQYQIAWPPRPVVTGLASAMGGPG